MLVRVLCSHCQQSYKVAENDLGKPVKCKKCGQSFRLEPEPNMELVDSTEPIPQPHSQAPTPICDWLEESPGQELRARNIALRTSYVGLAFVLMSLTMVWAVSYSAGLGHSGRMATYGGWIFLPALVLLGTVLVERKATEKAKTEQHTKVAGTCCVLICLWAGGTLFSTMAVGQSTMQSEFGNFSAGIKPGPGPFVAMLGAVVCMVGQAILLQPHLLNVKQLTTSAPVTPK